MTDCMAVDLPLLFGARETFRPLPNRISNPARPAPVETSKRSARSLIGKAHLPTQPPLDLGFADRRWQARQELLLDNHYFVIFKYGCRGLSSFVGELDLPGSLHGYQAGTDRDIDGPVDDRIESEGACLNGPTAAPPGEERSSRADGGQRPNKNMQHGNGGLLAASNGSTRARLQRAAIEIRSGPATATGRSSRTRLERRVAKDPVYGADTSNSRWQSISHSAMAE